MAVPNVTHSVRMLTEYSSTIFFKSTVGGVRSKYTHEHCEVYALEKMLSLVLVGLHASGLQTHFSVQQFLGVSKSGWILLQVTLPL